MKPDCWWCCYPFEWESLHFPYAFKSNVFYTTGHFCSWECMKAYAIDRNKLEQCEYITLMRKRMEGKINTTKRAQTRYCLEKFGGTLKIEEFRRKVPCVVKIPGEVYQCHETIVSKSKEIVATTGDLRLKREKPLERSKGKLETSLGIIVKKCCPPVAGSHREKSQNNKKD